MSRYAIVILLLVMTVAPAAAEDITLQHLQWAAMFGDEISFIDNIAKEFSRQNPGVKVVFEVQGNMIEALTARAAGGVLPDVVGIRPNHAVPFFKQGILMNLTPLLARDPEISDRSFLPGMLEAYTLENGKEKDVFGLPYAVLAWAAVYNKEHFRAAGLPLPVVGPEWTWATARMAARRLTQSDAAGHVQRWGIQVDGNHAAGWLYWIALTHQAGAVLYDRPVDPRRLYFNTEPVKNALTWLFSLYEDGLAPLKFSLGDRRPSLESGEISLMVHGLPRPREHWTGSSLGAQADIGYIRQPLGPVRDGWLVDAQGFGIVASSPHTAAAWQWVKFLAARTESGHALVTARGRIPALRAAVPFFARNAPMHDIAGIIDTLGNSNNIPRTLPYEPVMKTAEELLSRALAKEISLQGAMEETDRIGNSLLAEYHR